MSAARMLAAGLMLAALVGCHNKAEFTQRAGAGNGIEVETLFTKDGCTVYRFHDGIYRYFTHCRGSTTWREGCGKNCSREVGIPGDQS